MSKKVTKARKATFTLEPDGSIHTNSTPRRFFD